MNSTRITVRIDAPRDRVYRAFLDADDIQRWMVPTGMSCTVHELDAREGGSFRITLSYDAPTTTTGKTTPNSDTYHGTFVELVPCERIVEVQEFETADAGMQGEMRMTITLGEDAGGTEITAVHENLPPALSAADNEIGWRASLTKLADLLRP